MSDLKRISQKIVSRYLVKSSKGWMLLKRYIPVRNPLFHATRLINLDSILREGLQENSFSQKGISLARSLQPLLGAYFGNSVIILDGDRIRRDFSLVPYAYPDIKQDEFEERVYTDLISPEYIKGVVLLKESHVEFLRKESQKWDVPVVYWSEKDGKFVRI